MSDISCGECQELGPEFALDTLGGEHRARMVRHLNQCPRCRATIIALTDTSERLMELMPEIPPPPAFEQRVLTALRPRPRQSRRLGVLAAAMLVMVALLGGGWLLGRQGSTPREDDDSRMGTRTLLYSPLTGANGQLGQVYLYPDDHAWMYLSSHAGQSPTTVSCAAIKTDKHTMPLGSYPLTNGQGGWALPTPIPAGAVVVATAYDATGHQMATAQFAPAQHE